MCSLIARGLFLLYWPLSLEVYMWLPPHTALQDWGFHGLGGCGWLDSAHLTIHGLNILAVLSQLIHGNVPVLGLGGGGWGRSCQLLDT
jgi:hypothetical protein